MMRNIFVSCNYVIRVELTGFDNDQQTQGFVSIGTMRFIEFFLTLHPLSVPVFTHLYGMFLLDVRFT